MFGILRSGQLVPHDCEGVSNGLLSRYRWWGGGGGRWIERVQAYFYSEPTRPNWNGWVYKMNTEKGQTTLSSLATSNCRHHSSPMKTTGYYYGWSLLLYGQQSYGVFQRPYVHNVLREKTKSFLHCYNYYCKGSFFDPNSSRKYFHLYRIICPKNL